MIGGGNAAVDVAITALRLGAEEVIMARRNQREMPALKWEIEQAVEEGVKLMPSWDLTGCSNPTGRLVEW